MNISGAASCKARLCASTAAAMAFAGIAAAQTVPPAPDVADAAVAQQIVVTGSRLAPPNSVSMAPVVSLAGEALIRDTGAVSIGDKLNDLPNIRSTYSEQNSTRIIGGHGLNLLDLYGLGAQRTLVLVDGRRHVGAIDILNATTAVDINTIPAGLIDRVDVLTGGASSVYGSDAIAGVVNFVLKKHFDGVEATVRGGVSQYGDAGAYLATITAGRNFAEGRGNIAGAFEYTHQTDFYGSDRPNTSRLNGFVVVEADPAGSPNGAAGGPDRLYFSDVRSATLSNGGTVSFASPSAACGRDPAGAAYTCKYLFQPDGTLVPQTGTRIGLSPNGNFVGGNGNNLRDGQQLVLQPRQDRINANLLGHYDISAAITPFFEAKYVRVHTTGSAAGPAFIQGATLANFRYNTTYEQVRLDNPFLSAQARALITQQLIAAGTPAASITDATRFAVQRNLLELGVRDEDDVRRTMRFVGGVRGDLGDGWHYEVSGNYGDLRETSVIKGNLDGQRFLLAMDSVRNAAGQIVCRSQIDASTASLAQLPGSSAATLAADIAACQPLNPFGAGNISQAARNYVLQDTVSLARLRQTDATAFIAGDTRQWFSLPGGPIGVSLGVEYRRETELYRQDPLVRQGYTFLNAIATLSAPAFAVKEAFAELRLPILRDRPFFEELTITGSGRVSDYKGTTGTVWTYNAGADWAPVRDFRVRGSYSRSIRAPNIAELYAGQSANFVTGFLDPCASANIAAGSTSRAANCAAAGIPTSFNPGTGPLGYVSGGNPNLTAEKSDSYTIGGVIAPRWVPGLTFSVDYYDIHVRNVIGAVAAQTIVNQCYDSATLNNPFCGLFRRNAATGSDAYQVTGGSLLQSSVNYASLKVRGLNFDAAYRHRIEGIGEISAHGVYTHALQRDAFFNPASPGRADRILGELGDPIDAFNVDVDVQRGKATFGYGVRFIGHMVLSAWEDTHSVQGRAPENADYADRQFYPAIWYHNLRGAVDVTARLTVFGGIDNLTNRMPPFGLTGTTAGGGIYDVRGRYFYTGAKVRL